LMPDERREFHNIRPASHTLLSVNCLYQMNTEKRKGVFTKLRREVGLTEQFASDTQRCDGRHSIAAFSPTKIISREAASDYSPRRKPWVNASDAKSRGANVMSHTSGNIILHLVFSTLDRRPLITPLFRSDLFAYLGGIVRGMRATALIVNGTADHVHMLIRIRPSQSAAEVARAIKANSSGWVRQKWSPDFGWQTGYGAFSVSESNVAGVARYIANQEEHHKAHSFQEEFVAFLKKNNVAYNEKYIWG
jgi:putative transposase